MDNPRLSTIVSGTMALFAAIIVSLFGGQLLLAKLGLVALGLNYLFELGLVIPGVHTHKTHPIFNILGWTFIVLGSVTFLGILFL